MRIAFFAPLKPPGHPVPSGDREMARNLIAALSHGGRAEISVASELRLRDGAGDAHAQARLQARAAQEAARIIRDLPGDTRAWVTYHNYYKAPDLIGPVVAKRRRLPYVLVESTRAQKRLTGPWADFARAAEDASNAADAIFYPTEHDRLTLERDRAGGQSLAHLPPFLPAMDLPPPGRPVAGRLLAAGMMRPGDKLESYRLIAAALDHLGDIDWHLVIAGDGPARAEVERLFAPFGARVRILGQLDRAAMADAYGSASVLVWPGVNEAFGMVYLEAQAAGLPVVAQDRPGVRDVLAPGAYPAVDAGPAALAQRIAGLLGDTGSRCAAGAAAREFVAGAHLLPAASARLWSVLGPLAGAPA